MPEPEDQEPEEDNSVIRDLREKAKRGAEAEQRAAELEKKLAFTEAGVDLSDERTVKYFLPLYDGEMTADAIRAAAEKDGFIKVPEPEPNADAEALQRIAEASMGATTPDVLTDAAKASDAEMQKQFAYVKGKDPMTAAHELAQYLESKGQPVAYDGPRPFSDGKIFKPTVR